MARIRSVKPEFWGDRKLARLLSRDARLLYVAMWNQADEHGRLQGDPRFIKGTCLPYDDDVSLDDIDRLVDEIVAARRAQRYEHEGDPYLYLPKLAAHQRLEPAKVPSRLPEPPPMPDPDHDPHAGARQSAPRADESAPTDDESSLLYVAGSREHGAGGRCAAPASGGAALAIPDNDPTQTLLAEHVAAYTQPPPLDAQAKAKTAIMRLVAERIEPDRIRAGLARLRERQLSPSLLPQLVTEATPVAKPSTTQQRVAAGAELVRIYRERGE